jgi:5-methylcytosine-specific restriction endonuclease McrA
MHDYTLTHLRDDVLLRDLATLVAQDRITTATLLAHIAEADARRLFAPAGYSSMHAYCVEELRLSEDAAYKRIQAARAARRFPALFPAMAEGRLHLTAVCLLAPHLTVENSDELIAAVTHKRKSEVEELLAWRFSPPEVPARIRAIPAIAGSPLVQLAPEQVENEPPVRVDTTDEHVLQGPVGELPAQVAKRFFVPLTISESTRDKLRYAQGLLSHALPNGDVAQVFDRALDALIPLLEKQKFGAITGRPRRRRTVASVRKRHIPAQVRRAVWERDQGRCTFVSASGTRCKARRFIEFDHVDPVARGGETTVERMRLRCRAHNQHEAERTFGAGFMARKRQEAQLAAAEARAKVTGKSAGEVRERTAIKAEADARAAAEAEARTAAKEQAQDLMAGLRGLGCRADEARRAAEFSQGLPDATLEERMRAALKFLGRRSIQGHTPAEALHPQSQGIVM